MVKAKQPSIDPSSQHGTGGVLGARVSRRTVLKAAGVGAGAAALAAAPVGAATRRSAPARRHTADQNKGGTIRLGAFEGGLVDGLLPWKSFGQEFFWNWTAQPLVSIAPDGSILYDLAESFEVSEDGKTYTFKLVDGATWHDGTPVTAKDVAFTYNTGLKATTAGSNVAGRIAPIAGSADVVADETKDASGIRVIDDHTIAFDLTEPNAQILPNLFAILRIAPAHVFEGVAPADYATTPYATGEGFIGSGPYKVEEFVVKQYTNLVPHEGYKNGMGYSGAPAADKVSIRMYDSADAQILSTQSGEVDFNYVRKPSGDVLAQLNAIDGMHTNKSLVGFNIFVSTNLKNPTTELLKDKRVRQAMVWALDRDVLVNDVLGGVFKVPDVMNHWIAPWANPDDLERYYPQNVEKAKALLAEAGWDPNVTLDIRHYPPTLDPDVPVILSMWEDVGIKGTLTPLPDDSFIDDFYADKDPSTPEDDGPRYDLAFVYGFGTLDGSPWGSDETLGSTRVYPNGFNSMRFANEEWDKEFAAALKETTQEGQAEHFKNAARIFNDELPYTPLYQRVDYAIVSDKLKGPEDAIITHPAAGGVKYWEWYVEE